MPDPVQLSPAEQAQFDQQAAASAPQPVTLPPDEQAQFDQSATPAGAPTPQPANPLKDFSAQELAELNTQSPKDFSLVNMWNQAPDSEKTPEALGRFAEAHDIVSNRAFYQDLPSVGTVLGNIWNLAKDIGHAGATAVSAAAKTASFAAPGGDKTAREQTKHEIQQSVANAWAGFEADASRLANSIGNFFIEKQTHPSPQTFVPGFGGGTAQVLGEAPEFTAAHASQRKIDNFLNEAAQANQQKQILSGKGQFLQAVGGQELDALAKAGYPVQPEEAARFASASPFTWYAYGKAFALLPEATKALIPANVQNSIKAISDAATQQVQKAVGASVGAAGGAAGIVAKGVEKAAPIAAPLGAAVTGFHHYGLPGAVVGLVMGHGGAGALEKIGGLMEKTAKGATTAGEEIAGAAAPTSNLSRAAIDVIQGIPKVAGSTAQGAALDLALQAATAKTPEEKSGFAPVGTLLGATHGLFSAGKWVLGGQLAGERNWGTTSGAPNSQAFPELNRLHNAAMSSAPPTVQERIRAIQTLKQGVAPGTDVFYIPPTGEGEADPLVDALQNIPGAEHLAFQSGNSYGVFLKGLKGADNKTRNVIVFRQVDAAPHEAIHAMDAALGDQRVAELNAAAKEQYGDLWNKFTQQYAQALNGGQPLPTGATAGDFLLDRSGFGAEAARLKTGGDSTDWQTVLTPEEKQAAVDKYVGGEIRAENGDAYIRGGNTPDGYRNKIAAAGAELVSLLGGNPLEGRTSKNLGLPLRFETFKQAGQALGEARASIPPAARPIVTKGAPSPPPVTQEQIQQNADDARTIATQVPDEKPTGAEGEQSPKEALGTIAEAIANQGPVRYQYRGAAGETPTGGALETDVTQRQSEIEQARNVPEGVRNLFERVGFPYKVEMSGKGPQVLDWAPVNLAANAFRWAKALSELAKRNPNAPELSRVPYPLDVAKGEFTQEGWRQLFEDAQKFTQNQLAGFGGAGQPVVVPAELGAANVFAPPRTSAEAPATLSQDRSDFINLLYGERPPETPRVSRKSGVPLNVVAQKVSAATEPGRIVEPSRIHAKPKQAAELGVEPGTLVERKPFKQPILGVSDIQEVNPARGALENALQGAGIEVPKLTKVVRRLNLEHIHSVKPEENLPRTAGANVLTTTAGFLPSVPDFLDRLDRTSPEEWRNMSHTYQGKFGGGQTGLSWDVGANAKSQEEVASLRTAQDKFGGMVREALKNKDFISASVLGSKAQAAREAYEAATDTGGTSEFIRRYHPEAGFKAPFPETASSATGQFMHDLEGIRRMNAEEIARRRRQGETETTRNSSYAGDSSSGIILHSAKQRSTAFLRPGQGAKDFEDAWNSAKNQTDRNALVESYFTKGSGQFIPATERTPEETRSEPKTILVRHGSTDMNNPDPDKDRIRGHMDIPLSEEGQSQARELGQQLKNSGIQKIYASDLSRTMDTAKEISKTTGAPVTPDPRLRPWNFGPTIEGKPTSDMLPKIAELAKNPDQRPPGGETFNEYKDRFLQAYHEIQDQHPDEHTAIVTHYRGTKLMDAWRAAGVDNDEVVPSVFEEYDKNKKPGSFQVMDKQGNELPTESARSKEAPITHVSDEELNSAPGMTRAQTEAIQKQPGTFEQAATAQFKPRDEKEIELRHWSNVPGLKILDPAFHGTGLSGDERIRARDYKKIYIPRTYFGTPDYAKEPNLGPEQYRAFVRRSKLYPFQEDPKDLWPSPEEVEAAGYAPMDSRAANTLYENKIAKAGYEGYIHRDAQVAAKFTKTPVEYVGAEGAAQFLPSTEPRAIRAAAVQDKDTGKIFEGPLHFYAHRAMLEAGYKPQDLFLHPQGFVTNEGEFLDRQQAADRALEMNQVRPEGRGRTRLIAEQTEMARPTAEEQKAGDKFIKRFLANPLAPAAPAEPATGQFRPKGAPKLEDFTDEESLAKALNRPGWAILTGTEEKKGPGTAPVNVAANERLAERLKELGYDFLPVEGNYKGVPQGINYVVTGISPQDALALGKEFNQESILAPQGLVYQDGSVHPVKPGETVIGPKAKKSDFYSQVLGGPAFSMGLDFENKLPPEAAPVSVARPEQQLMGGEFSPTKEPLSTKNVGDMTPAELKEHYPEAVVPEDKDKGIPSDIKGSPLFKEAGSEAEAVKVFAKRLADFARQWKDNPAYKDGLRWYSEFVPMLKKAYGKHAQLMAELLAATSPQTNPETNFAIANDAFEMFKNGKFDKQIAKYEEGLAKLADGTWSASGAKTPAAFLADWIDKYDLKPRQSNGKLYLLHSVPVLQVLARRWLENTGGPKTQNFVKNLLGTGHGATYDVWADRTLRRIGYSGHQARWRILPGNGVGVSDADFAFGQKVFSTAAKELGVRPDSLQGALWFAEKQLWADNGWGRLDLGDFRKEIRKRELLNRGVQQRIARTEAQSTQPAQEQTRFDLGVIQPR